METEARVAFINSQTACMLARLESMKVQNTVDAIDGRSPSYRQEAFEDLPDQFGLGHNTVVAYLMGV